MSDPTEPASSQGLDLPPTLRAERDGPPLPKRPWHLGIGPAYLTIFVSAPFFDPLWMGDLTRAGPLALAAVAVASSISCYAIFFYPMAIWGNRTRHGLGVLSSSTFGMDGSEWITGVGLGVAELVWYAVAIGYAVESTLLGLVTTGLVGPEVLGRWEVGPLGLKTPVFLCAAAFWIFITGSASLLRLIAVIAALMKIYAPVALFLLTGAALWMVPALGGFRSADAVAVANRAGLLEGGPRASALSLFTGFFAMLGLSSVDWGAASLRKRDVTVGGLAGIVLAGSWTSIMSLLVVAGALGRPGVAGRDWPANAADPPLFSFRWGIVHGIGGYPAAAILILFGLATLAPACYAAWGYSSRFAAHLSMKRRLRITWPFGAVALLLIATSWPSRLDSIDFVMGLIFAPIVGAMVGDFLCHRGGWAGVRQGVNPPGVIACLGGLAGRVAGEMAANRSLGLVSALLASPIIGFVSAVFAYWLTARIGLERPSIHMEPAGPLDRQAGSVSTGESGAGGPIVPELPPSDASRQEPG